MSDLAELAKPFPPAYVREKPGKFSAQYVEHSVITQRLLEVVGPFTFRVVDLVRNADGTVSGCLAELTVEVDGRQVTVTEAGDVEHPGENNGSNVKNAASDAIKRCAMRLGLGLGLWAQENFYLDRALAKRDGEGG